MSNGLKNIQSHARAHARRERLESGQPLTGYDDDSGLGGLTPIDDVDVDVDVGDQSYSSPETGGAHSTPGGSSGSGGSGGSSAAASFAAHLQHHGQAVSAVAGYATYGGYHHQPAHHHHHHHGHGYSNSVSSTGTAPGAGYGGSAAGGGGSSSTGTSPYLGHGNRLPSVGDMGIDAMLNRGPGGAGNGQV